MKKKFSYLALGDSYTIGEQVLPEDNFPNQTVKLLNKTGTDVHHFTAPKIIAQTGWTTDELDSAIDATNILKQYDIVSLLIGVNNQYRGRAVKDFKIEFEHLLQRAIQFAGNKPNHVFVLSIPDWGVTPFAEGRDRKQIADEIDVYNLVCEKSAAAFKTLFINITTSQRGDGNKMKFLAPDGLHPSGMEYKKWADKLVDEIWEILQ
jgi:lysophospholipase L1-like esterase